MRARAIPRGGRRGVAGLRLEQVALPLRHRLVGADRGGGLGGTGLGLGVAPGVRSGGGPGDEALGDGVGHDARQQRGAADGVVVARDLVVDLVRVAVRVEDRDHRDTQLVRLADGDVLLLGVDDPDGAGHLGHLADAAEGALQLVLLALEDQLLLLGGHALPAGLLASLELLEALQTLVDSAEVGQHAAQPALVDVGHPDPGGLLGDGLLGLLLRTDEEDGAAVGDGLLDELVGAVDVRQRLEQVDDVDAVALGEDEALHLRVPAAGLVPEVDAALEQLSHADDCHGSQPFWSVRAGGPLLG